MDTCQAWSEAAVLPVRDTNRIEIGGGVSEWMIHPLPGPALITLNPYDASGSDFLGRHECETDDVQTTPF